MSFKIGHVLTAVTTIVLVVGPRALATPDGKGSDSLYNSDDVTSKEENTKEETRKKQTGNQHKFWVPTYHGNNPLNRRKIGITSSEIEKYDKSIDVSLSGVGKKRNVSEHKNTYDVPSIPILWSGDEISSHNNETIPFFDSDGISLEQSKSVSTKKQHLKSRKNKLTEKITVNSIGERIRSNKKPSNVELYISTRKPNELENKTKVAQHDSLGKEKVSQLFFNELHRIQQNESEKNSDYYKNLVKAATENTKKKLGYKNTNPIKPSKLATNPQPEVFAIDLSNKHAKTPINHNKIDFSTRHEQTGGMDKEFNPKLKNPITESKKEIKCKSKPEFVFKENTTAGTLLSNKTGAKIERYYNTINNTMEEIAPLEKTKRNRSLNKDESLAEFEDYSAWSDVLYQNKTQRKGKKRKSKTGMSELLKTAGDDREIPKWSKQEFKSKVDKLRAKESKLTRRQKRQRALKKRDSTTSGKRVDDRASYENYSDERGKKLRMRRPEEKRYAVNSVKNYFNEMDQKYKGRPREPERFKQSDRYESGRKSYYRSNTYRNPNYREESKRDSWHDQRGDFGGRRGRGSSREDNKYRGEGRWGNRHYGRRSDQREYRDRGPPKERSWSDQGWRGRDSQRRNDRYNERGGDYDFRPGEGKRYGNDRREYRGREQGRDREKYVNVKDRRYRQSGRRGGRGRRGRRG